MKKNKLCNKWLSLRLLLIDVVLIILAYQVVQLAVGYMKSNFFPLEVAVVVTSILFGAGFAFLSQRFVQKEELIVLITYFVVLMCLILGVSWCIWTWGPLWNGFPQLLDSAFAMLTGVGYFPLMYHLNK